MTEPARVLRYRQLARRPSLWHRPAREVLTDMGIEGDWK